MGIPHDVVETLYAELGPALLAYARSIVGDRAEAEDVLQHVFLKLLSSDLALPREARPYLFRAVRNTCLNRRRSQGRHPAGGDRPMFTAANGLHELACDLEQALRDLPDEQREVVVLRVWGEMTLHEAAQVLDISINTAASRYRYALGKLRLRFGAHVDK